MPTPTVAVHDALTGETIVRDMNDAELAQYEADQAAAVEAAAVAEAEAQAKADARAALLDRLGLTEAEAVLLLGG
jgi:hypothetical protein